MRDLNDIILTDDVLEERAREYGRQDKGTNELKGDLLSFIGLRLTQEWYLIEMRYMEEIVRMAKIARIPRSDKVVLGVTNVRGNLCLVIDVKTVLGLAGAQKDNRARLMLTRHKERITGIVADEISEVMAIDSGLFQPAIVSLQGSRKEYIKGIYKPDKKALIWLDIEKVITEVEKILAKE